ncbi:polysaccharide biosynthesis C-terminal domain-containing protein [Natronococcus sp. A-GB1]|uniref:oligosaccharide flippase family protein n=1 Tax=Natronococcus sp. A-GB1 TaxID=3037648 RepID=UPI00241F0164|nr:polysaccharide biosynthesis C-terminal domain-containing protein [Natronococcus sp. A-GB1]MDG5761816.1 polysaccharide biosynthesis C-terminal domain-containing protein [Natronococcus sp. A-GB1]
MADSLSSAVRSVVASKLFVVLAGFLFTPALVRLLGPTEYGRYALVLSIFGIVNIVVIGGTSDAVRKYISERSDPAWQAAVYGYVFRPALGLGLAVGATFWLAAWSGLAARAFGDPFTSLFYLLGVYAVASQLAYHNLRTLMGLERESRSEPLKVLEKTLFVTVALGLVYAGFGVEGVLLGHILASLAAFVLALVFIAQSLPLRSLFSPPSVDLPKRGIVGYLGSTILFFLFLNSLYHVDVILLQYWWTDETVGYYKGALSIAEFLWLAPTAVQLVLLQRISNLWASDDLEAIQQQARRATRYVFLFTTLLAVGVAALAADFVPLYLGTAFEPSVTPLLLLLPGVLGFAVARPTLAINQGRRSLRPLLAATGACSLVNLALNLVLIPPYGMVGAAVATSIGYGSLVAFQSLAARYLGYRPLEGLRWRRILLSSVATAAVIVPVAAVLPALLALVVVPPLGAAVYATLVIVTGALTGEELADLMDGSGVVPVRLERRLLVVVDRLPKVNE